MCIVDYLTVRSGGVASLAELPNGAASVSTAPAHMITTPQHEHLLSSSASNPPQLTMMHVQLTNDPFQSQTQSFQRPYAASLSTACTGIPRVRESPMSGGPCCSESASIIAVVKEFR